jgi:hypothetical protein
MANPRTEFLAALKLAAVEFKKDQRLGAANSVLATIEFLRSTQAEQAEAELRTPLMALVAALGDAEAGRSNPIINRAKAGLDQQRKENLSATNEGSAVAAMDLLVRAGDTPEGAAEKLKRLTGKKLKQLITLRKDVRRGNASEATLKIYRSVLDEAAAAAAGGMTPDDQASTALLLLKQMKVE